MPCGIALFLLTAKSEYCVFGGFAADKRFAFAFMVQ